MENTLYSLSFLAISQLLFMGLFYLLYFRQQLLGKLLALLSFCLISFILILLPPISTELPVIYFLLGRLTIASPAVLWVIAHILFIDDKRISAQMWLLIIGYQVLRAIALLFFDESSLANTIIVQLTSLVMLGLALHVMLMAIHGRSDDLIEERRRLRVPFSLGFGTIVAIIVALAMLTTLLESEIASSLILYATVFSYVAIFVFTLLLNLATFRLYPESPLLIRSSSREKVEVEAEKQADEDIVEPGILEKINQLMENEKLYTEPKLTIGDLAQKISLQEYRLRRMINQGLGYRNFNQFLNKYRIDEASRLLINDNVSHLPISSIALEVGYASLSSFNKAFKEMKGVTPSAFRSSPVSKQK